MNRSIEELAKNLDVEPANVANVVKVLGILPVDRNPDGVPMFDALAEQRISLALWPPEPDRKSVV